MWRSRNIILELKKKTNKKTKKTPKKQNTIQILNQTLIKVAYCPIEFINEKNGSPASLTSHSKESKSPDLMYHSSLIARVAKCVPRW